MLIEMLAAAALSADVEVRTLAVGAAPAKAGVEDVSFLVGRWVGRGLGACAEESVLPAADGQIAGMFRQMRPDGGLWFYEFYTIVEKEGSLVFRIKHFGPDLAGWEEKDETVDFPLVAIEGDTAYFDGLSWRRSGKSLEAAVSVQSKAGPPTIERFTYTLAKKNQSCGG